VTTTEKQPRDRHDRMTLAVAILGVVIGACALGITSCQVQTIKDNAQRQMRAYVFLSNVRIRVDDTNNSLLVIDLTAKNFGNTPASEYYFWACTALREFPLTTPLKTEPANLKSPSNSVLAPSDKRFIHNPDLCDGPPRRPGGGIPPEERALLQNGTEAIYVYGALHYKDAWNEKRRTHFRLFYQRPIPYERGQIRRPRRGQRLLLGRRLTSTQSSSRTVSIGATQRNLFVSSSADEVLATVYSADFGKQKNIRTDCIEGPPSGTLGKTILGDDVYREFFRLQRIPMSAIPPIATTELQRVDSTGTVRPSR
jgi:hypothetical protein